MSKKLPDNQIAFYQSPDGAVNIEVLYAQENIWLTQKKMAELFNTTPQNITLHLKNIYQEGEVAPEATCKDFLQVQKEGGREVSRELAFYSLEAIIAVGYRVNSERGTQFRQWATGILKNYIHKGFALDSDRFKYGSRFSARYFDELYEEIRDIRSSERMLYQKITDIYATAIDYSPKAFESKQFFATVQNKLHFAITGQTAAEIIKERADGKKAHMGLTTWRRAPKGKIMPSDVMVAKNYLNKDELTSLNRIVNMYLDYAEMQAARHIPVTMQSWIDKLNAFLQFNEREILTDAGKISHAVAQELALKEYEHYRKVQDREYISDFDIEVKKMLAKDNAAAKKSKKPKKGPTQ
ncbi:MAG: virulence RhuM family protein [Candidatus Omnitrophota bacterium]